MLERSGAGNLTTGSDRELAWSRHRAGDWEQQHPSIPRGNLSRRLSHCAKRESLPVPNRKAFEDALGLSSIHPESGYGGHRSRARRGGLSRLTNLNFALTLRRLAGHSPVFRRSAGPLPCRTLRHSHTGEPYLCFTSGLLLFASLRTVDIAIDVPAQNR